MLQAVGGALSCVATTEEQVDLGVSISLAGLIFQVVTLSIFVVLLVDYVMRCSGSSRVTSRVKIFILALMLGTVFIFIRCSYRIKELSEGYFSEFFRDETLFIALEST